MKNNIKKTMTAAMMAAVMMLGGTQAAVIAGAAENVQANAGYDKYQNVFYTDKAGAQTKVRVLANAQESAFQLQMDYYGMKTVLDVIKTGANSYYVTNGDFFQTAGQDIVKQAIENGVWAEA